MMPTNTSAFDAPLDVSMFDVPVKSSGVPAQPSTFETLAANTLSSATPEDASIDANKTCAAVVASLLQGADPRIPSDSYDEAIQRLLALREKVVYWASGWGGIVMWPDTLNMSLLHAVNGVQVERFTKEIFRHASSGRRLLATLQQIEGSLPEEEWQVKELWRISVELVQILVKGITIMESRVSLLPLLEPASGDDESDADPPVLSGMELVAGYTSEGGDEDFEVHNWR